jgi:hypothetical protein
LLLHQRAQYRWCGLTFKEWIQRWIDERYKNPTAFAKALGMQLTPFKRGWAAGTFNVVNLLKLARITGEHPSTVLRMARKKTEADLIEEMYGPGRETLTLDQREFLRLFDAIQDQATRHALRVTMTRLALADEHDDDDDDDRPLRRDAPAAAATPGVTPGVKIGSRRTRRH